MVHAKNVHLIWTVAKHVPQFSFVKAAWILTPSFSKENAIVKMDLIKIICVSLILANTSVRSAHKWSKAAKIVQAPFNVHSALIGLRYSNKENVVVQLDSKKMGHAKTSIPDKYGKIN